MQVSCHKALTMIVFYDVLGLTGTLLFLTLTFFLAMTSSASSHSLKVALTRLTRPQVIEANLRLVHQFVQKDLFAMTLAITCFIILSSFAFLVRLEGIHSQNRFPWPLLNENHRSQCKMAKRIRNQEQMKEIKGCVQVIGQPGTYIVRPTTDQDRPCGVYLAGMHNEIITIDIQYLDVSCENEGVVAFFDGWEMNGHIFPSEFDHPKSLDKRVIELCKETLARSNGQLRLKSSQNAALLQYKSLQPRDEFIFKVSMEIYRNPCNVLMTEESSMVTLFNGGHRRNCSLTTFMNPPNIKLTKFQIGKPSFYEANIISPCLGNDYLEIGGGDKLDPVLAEIKESICGRQPIPARKGLTIMCDTASVRLVSSGRYFNSVTLQIQEVQDEDLKYERNLIMHCSEYK